MNVQIAHARLIPVPMLPPELLLVDPELPLAPPSSPVYAQPAGSSQHVAGMHVPPEQALPMSATGHS
jgi:hypothetical protein